MAYIIIKYLHIVGVLILFATLLIEHILLKKEMTPNELGKISIIDGIYGISAIVVLLAGLTLWFLVGKPADFYNSNIVFHIKITLFVVVGILSIRPTIFFLKNRKSTEATVEVPKSIIMLIRIELLLVLIIPILAITMAQGYRII